MEQGAESSGEVFKNVFITRVRTESEGDAVWRYVLASYEQMRGPGLRPLLVTRVQGTGEVRLTVEASGSTEVADLILEHFSGREDVHAVQVVNLMKPYFYPVPQDAMGWDRYTLFLMCEASHCRSAYDRMVSLEEEGGTVPTTLAMTFSNGTYNMLLSFLSKDRESLDGYLDAHVRTITGITDIQVTEIERSRRLSERFEWKRTVLPITTWEALTGRDYGDDVYRDVNQGC